MLAIIVLFFLNSQVKKQYKTYTKEGIMCGVYNSKEMADEHIAQGIIERYEEVPEQVSYNNKFYDKNKLPISYYFYKIKFFLFYVFYQNIQPQFVLVKKIVACILYIIVFALIFSSSFFLIKWGISNLPKEKDWVDLVAAIFPSIVGFCSLIAAICSILYTKQSLSQQKEQWIKSEFIKREAKILLEFRDTFFDTQESRDWFLYTLLQPLRFGNSTPTQEQLTIKIELYCMHYNKIRKLNDMYNANQLIFRKNNIDKQMIYIVAMLKTIYSMSGNDLVAVFYQKTETALEYIFTEYRSIAGSFLTDLDFEFVKNKLDPIKELQKTTLNRDNEKQLKKYIDKASMELNALMFKLDELVTYYDGNMPGNLKMRQMYFVKNAEEYFSCRVVRK